MLNRKATPNLQQNRRPKQLAMEAVEARKLMAADVMSGLGSLDADGSEPQVAEVQTVDQQAEAQTTSISNGFAPLRFGLPDLRVMLSKIDVWEHGIADIGDSGQDGFRELSIGDSGQDGFRDLSIGDSGLDGVDYVADVDSIFASWGGEQEAADASSLPDKYLGVIRWNDLFEYFQALDKLEDIAREMDFDFSGSGFDFEPSLARARQDAELTEREFLTPTEFVDVVDRVIDDLNGDTEADNSSSDSETNKFEDRIAEALQEMKERMVVYWQTISGPGHVVSDPFGVADDRD